MRQDEDISVIGRIVAPPPAAVIRPVATDWSEHVAPEYPGSNVLESAPGQVWINFGEGWDSHSRAGRLGSGYEPSITRLSRRHALGIAFYGAMSCLEANL